MRLKALSHYNGDMDTRFGDCILLYDSTSLVVYDCGHNQHASEVEKFLRKNTLISQVYIVISHNDSDHTDGVESLMEYLHSNGYDVTVYSSLYLKSARKVLELLDDGRRTLPATKQHILETFDNIKNIIEKAQGYGFSIKNATVGTKVLSGSIVGPTEDEFAAVVAQAMGMSLVKGVCSISKKLSYMAPRLLPVLPEGKGTRHLPVVFLIFLFQCVQKP